MSKSTIHRSCTFRVGEACFALPADGVVEVLRGGSLARVPRAPEGVLGLLHLRGRIVPIIDPAAQLGISRVAEQRATHLVIELQDDWYGLVIDEMLDVVEIPADRVEQAVAPVVLDHEIVAERDERVLRRGARALEHRHVAHALARRAIEDVDGQRLAVGALHQPLGRATDVSAPFLRPRSVGW